MGLPGHVSKVYPTDRIPCDFTTCTFHDTIIEMQEKGVCSDQTLDVLSKTKDSGCKLHADYCIQGETDSFGAEYDHYCQEHFHVVKEIRAFQQKQQNESGDSRECDLCGSLVLSSDIKPTRDYDEGLNGPVYYACSCCRNTLNVCNQDE